MKAAHGALAKAMTGRVAACAPQVADKAQARTELKTLGVGCHGGDSRGRGAAAQGMAPAPADLTQVALRDGKVFPRLQVMGYICDLPLAAVNRRCPSPAICWTVQSFSMTAATLCPTRRGWSR